MNDQCTLLYFGIYKSFKLFATNQQDIHHSPHFSNVNFPFDMKCSIMMSSFECCYFSFPFQMYESEYVVFHTALWHHHIPMLLMPWIALTLSFSRYLPSSVRTDPIFWIDLTESNFTPWKATIGMSSLYFRCVLYVAVRIDVSTYCHSIQLHAVVLLTSYKFDFYMVCSIVWH